MLCSSSKPESAVNSSPRNVLVADDHPVVRDAMQLVVKEAFPDSGCCSADNLDAARELLAHDGSIDLVLLDLYMPGMDGLAGLVSLRNSSPDVPVVVVSAETAPAIIAEAAACGAAGFIEKSLPREQMVETLRSVCRGERCFPQRSSGSAGDAAACDAKGGERPDLSELTSQQRRVLELIVDGHANKVIAYELGITESTVKTHVSAILRRFKVHSRTQIVLAMRHVGDRAIAGRETPAKIGA